MRLFCGKQRGSICVFLTLVLVPVLMFSGIMVDASRLFASKTSGIRCRRSDHECGTGTV